MDGWMDDIFVEGGWMICKGWMVDIKRVDGRMIDFRGWMDAM